MHKMRPQFGTRGHIWEGDFEMVKLWYVVTESICVCIETSGSRDSSVGIATGYGLDDRGVGVRVPVGSRIFSCQRCADRLCGSLQWEPGVKRAGRESDRSPPANAEIKKIWIYKLTPHAASWLSA
jgi:hypothetical protein